VGLLTVASVAVYVYLHLRQAHHLTEQDTVVLADFTNTTGDPVFDDALERALSIQLAQSPFLNILSNQKVRDTLKLMGRSPNERVTRQVAQEIGVRTGSKVVLAGSIASLGSQYVVGLDGVNCTTGDVVVREQMQAASKERVLEALGAVASDMRAKLGESLSSIQKFDTPIRKVTTHSLEALKAFSLGAQADDEKGVTAAIPFYQRAIELDPDFAAAYLTLGGAYSFLLQAGLADENFKRALDLRDRVSELEKFDIQAEYYTDATRELEKAARTLELWKETYPRDTLPHFDLGIIYTTLGQHQKALSEAREYLRLEPGSGSGYVELAIS
jgi:tetratricopeptide (TPR) repeat protein